MTQGFREGGWYRSVLFQPAHREDAESVLAGTAADAVMLDLEDGVPAADKARARQAARELARERWTPFVALRINTTASGQIEADLEALGPGIDAVILPKSETEEELRALDALLAAREGERREPVRIVALIETCAGALAAPRLAAACPRVLTLGLGASDFVADIGAPVSRAALDPEALSLARRMLVLGARGAGRPGPFDGGKFEPGRPGWDEACEHARRIGFQGKVCFDEAQAETANAVFAAREGESVRLPGPMA